MWNKSEKNGMEINDELLACYVEGTATAEERAQVRQYLCEHPEEYVHILSLMDEDIEDHLNEYAEDSCEIVPFESSFSDIACSAAAFAPQQKKISSKNKSRLLRMDGFYERLGRLYDDMRDENMTRSGC